jgi:hypothetical protein
MAISARFRRWTGVEVGIVESTYSICSMVGTRGSRRVLAIRVSFSDMLK